jgi:nucleoside 2-deoxyribosyltransferase
MRVYLAGPFFTAAELDTILQIEMLLTRLGIDHFSPRRDQPQFKPTAPMAEKRAMAKRIFNTNIDQLGACEKVLACIDDFDPGTIFEIGVAWGLGVEGISPTIIAFTTQGHGLNLMLSEACDGFLSGLDQIEEYFKGNTRIAQAWKGDVI